MWKDSETNIDYLNVQYMIKLIKSIIADDSLSPATIGVYGDWGSGKSSIIEMSLDSFREADEVVTVKFNGWLFEGYEDAKTVLLSSILDELVASKKIDSKFDDIVTGLYKSIDKIKLAKKMMKFGTDIAITGGVGTAVELGLGKIKNLISKETVDGADVTQIKAALDQIQNEKNLDDYRKDINYFRENFAELINKTKINKLVIYIDELDRCNPDTILETLEAIRLFLFVEKIYFIIGADERHIQYSVQRKFSQIEGNQINIGKEYLEKIVQYPINIPRMRSGDVDFYLLFLLCEKELEPLELEKLLSLLVTAKNKNPLVFDIRQIISTSDEFKTNEKIKVASKISRNMAPILSRELNGNPRQCKRFLNTLKMRQTMASYNNQELDMMILSKLMLLEYFKSDVFDLLMESLVNDNNEVWNEIVMAEKTDGFSFSNPILQKLLDTVWGKVWFRMEPQIGNQELESYFYYSREKNKGKEDLVTFKLSPVARQVLDKLESQSFDYKEKVKELNDGLPLVDQQEILEIFFNEQIDKTDKVENEKFEALLFYGTISAELIPNLANVLKVIPIESIGLGVAPYISSMTSKIDNKEILDIFNGWREQVPILDKAIKSFEKE